MPNLDAFVGHSFLPEDEKVVQTFMKFFTQIQGMNIGFSWVNAQEAEPRELADKIKGLMKDRNVFIGICTKREAAIGQRSRSRFILNLFFGKGESVSFKTSDWIIQEIGMAIGKEMSLILLIEEGLRLPGELQVDLEYIQFNRKAPSEAFGRVLEMVKSLTPKAKQIKDISIETAEPTREEVRVSNDSEWIQPQPYWDIGKFDSALIKAIATGQLDKIKTVEESFFDSDDGKIPKNRHDWMVKKEYYLFLFNKGGRLTELESLANEFPENYNAQFYFAQAYENIDEYGKAAEFSWFQLSGRIGLQRHFMPIGMRQLLLCAQKRNKRQGVLSKK